MIKDTELFFMCIHLHCRSLLYSGLYWEIKLCVVVQRMAVVGFVHVTFRHQVNKTDHTTPRKTKHYGQRFWNLHYVIKKSNYWKNYKAFDTKLSRVLFWWLSYLTVMEIIHLQCSIKCRIKITIFFFCNKTTRICLIYMHMNGLINSTAVVKLG